MALPGFGVATRSTCCAPRPTRCSYAFRPATITNVVLWSRLWRALQCTFAFSTGLLPSQAINFASYDAYKLLLQGDDAELTRFKSFAAGALAGGCTTRST